MKVVVSDMARACSPYPFLNKSKYKGRGRPKNKDYDWRSIEEIQNRMNNVINERIKESR